MRPALEGGGGKTFSGAGSKHGYNYGEPLGYVIPMKIVDGTECVK